MLPRTWAWLPGRPGASPLATTPLSPSCGRLGGLNPPGAQGGRGLSHTHQAGGAGRIGGPGMAPVPQSHPGASPSMPSLHPLRPQPPSSALCNSCWCQDAARPVSAPSQPHPIPALIPTASPFTLTLILYCTPPSQELSRLGFDPGSDSPRPTPNPLYAGVGEGPTQSFPGLLISTESQEPWEVPIPAANPLSLAQPYDIHIAPEPGHCNTAAPAAWSRAGAAL